MSLRSSFCSHFCVRQRKSFSGRQGTKFFVFVMNIDHIICDQTAKLTMSTASHCLTVQADTTLTHVRAIFRRGQCTCDSFKLLAKTNRLVHSVGHSHSCRRDLALSIATNSDQENSHHVVTRHPRGKSKTSPVSLPRTRKGFVDQPQSGNW